MNVKTPETLSDVLNLLSLPFAMKGQIPTTSGVYFVLGKDGAMLYVGQSENLRDRFTGHNRVSDFVKAGAQCIHWLECETADLLRIEGDCIFALLPTLNVDGKESDALCRDIAFVFHKFYGRDEQQEYEELRANALSERRGW